ASHLQNAGYQLHVYTRTKEKAEDMIDKSAKWEKSVAELAAKADVIISIIGTPKDVEDGYLGSDGIIANAKDGSNLVDMTYSKPALAERISDEDDKKGLFALDAPVSGGDVGAQNAKLTIMVGGDQKAFDKILPIFQYMGENIVLQGPAGAGQHTKA